MTTLATQKQEIFDYVYAMLGGGMVDVELDPIHYNTALTKALTRYRQRSDYSVEESYMFLTAVPDQNEYILPNEVVEVRQIFRRGVGARSGMTSAGGPIYTTSFTATASQRQTFSVNYNIASAGSIIVKVNGGATTDYVTNSDARTITFNTPLTPADVIGVEIYSPGTNTGGTTFDPFSLAYTNAYLLSSSGSGGLVTYELFSQYQELVGRMFGSFIEFKWATNSKKLTLLQRPRSNEELMLYCYNYRPDFDLMADYLAKQWLKDYTLAACKYMLGEARSKFATIAGPQGGSSLNGDTLKAEAQAEMEKLEQEVSTQMSGGVGYSFLIG